MRNPLTFLRTRLLERLAMNSFVAADFEKSAVYWRKLARLNPEHPGVHYNLGLVHMATKSYEEAEQAFQAELTRQGETPPLLKVLAELAFLKGERIAALDFYRKAARAEGRLSKEGQLLESKIALCSDDERFARALAAIDDFEAGCALMEDERFDEAEKKYQRAAEADPTHFLARNNLGVIAMNVQRDLKRARAFFEQADNLIDHPLVKANLRKLSHLEAEEQRT
ncbi:tetratricopeptide repeat protein [Desulfuromonas sp. KJ2020]|uniref:tetratricopeptide repeat protein n=1 Tax=Desulfuromonas sp. KJ2020 TaxID=2919173 RepID=UPI0020A7CBED|nr:tetratricopeptide repeat protein [Desulfuromonas sp. KJ2020]MCP3175619.1 tetratricopeptide repeat protein [Desulfuromonas sp. KJ2020]